MTALDILLDIILFSIIATGMWWTGTRDVLTETSKADYDPAESEADYECGDCGGAVSSIEDYPHDGSHIVIYRCAACTSEGAIIHHPDGHTSGRGCLAEQADETIETITLADGARALWRVLKRLIGGLTRIVQWLGSSASRDEKPCVESLRCDHEETRDRTVTECDDPSCDLLHVEQVCVDCGAHLGWRDAAREESVAESAEEAETVAADGGTPVGGDGLGTVVNRLQADFESAMVWLHSGDEAEHLTFYGDRSESLDTALVSYLLAEGFEILDAGQKECPATGKVQASVEIRRETARRERGERQ